MDEHTPVPEKDLDTVIESASATTSPDNARSGPTAYVIFAVAVGVLVALVAGLISCAGTVSDVAARSLERGGLGYSQGYGYGWDVYELYPDSSDDPLSELLDGLDLTRERTYTFFS